MLVLNLEKLYETDELIEINGINFAISNEAQQFANDISIYVKNGLGTEIVVKNNAKQTCKCGKSFKV
jgi:Fe-S cluster assembly iron-binding protein IscA